MKTDFSMENLVTLEFELGHVYNFLNFRYATIHTLFITFYIVAKLKSVKIGTYYLCTTIIQKMKEVYENCYKTRLKNGHVEYLSVCVNNTKFSP